VAVESIKVNGAGLIEKAVLLLGAVLIFLSVIGFLFVLPAAVIGLVLEQSPSLWFGVFLISSATLVASFVYYATRLRIAGEVTSFRNYGLLALAVVLSALASAVVKIYGPDRYVDIFILFGILVGLYLAIPVFLMAVRLWRGR
jgi:hypothetical protein